MWLADAVIQAQGPTKEVVRMYRTAVEQNAMLVTSNEGDLQILKAEVNATDGGQIRSECDVEVCLTINAPESLEGNFFIGVSQGTAFPMFVVYHHGILPGRGFPDPLRPQPHSPPEGALFDLGGHGGMQSPANTCRGIPWSHSRHSDPISCRPPDGVMILTPIYVKADWQVN